MGLLRFLLAASVIIAHSQPYHGLKFVGGPLAVEAFFMISGFYIGMILNEKYLAGKGSYWLFISNRFLRLYPLYWVVLIITIIAALIVPNYNKFAYVDYLGSYFAHGDKLSISTWGFITFSHVVIFFQDLVFYLGLDLHTGNLYLTHSFHNTDVKVFQFMVVNQAWSIALELMFYLTAPFIVRNKTLVLGLLIGSFSLKYFASLNGYGDDPWSYRFFPFELGYFLLGTVGYFIYTRYVKHWKIPKVIYIIDFVLVSAMTIFLKNMNLKYDELIYLTLVFLSIPLLFNYTKKFKFDRKIGELSYPIYLIHLVVINSIVALQISFHPDLIVIVLTVGLSHLLIKYVGNPIERVRQNRVFPKTV